MLEAYIYKNTTCWPATAYDVTTGRSAENESELLDCDDAIFLTSSDSAASALLGYAQEEQEMFEGEKVETEPSQFSCTAYDELLEVMDHKIISLKTPSLPSKP